MKAISLKNIVSAIVIIIGLVAALFGIYEFLLGSKQERANSDKQHEELTIAIGLVNSNTENADKRLSEISIEIARLKKQKSNSRIGIEPSVYSENLMKQLNVLEANINLSKKEFIAITSGHNNKILQLESFKEKYAQLSETIINLKGQIDELNDKGVEFKNEIEHYSKSPRMPPENIIKTEKLINREKNNRLERITILSRSNELYPLSSVAVAETQTVSVDAGFNCCRSDYYKSCAVKVHLSPGRYVFRPVDGALSRWGDDYTAYAQGTQPWEWHVWIHDGSQQEPWSLGSLVRYKTKSEALQRQQNQRVNITLRQQSTIYIWTEDEYQGKEYCTDNRGELILEIKKVD